MAFGFIKKIFSFGKKQVEEVPAEDEAAEAATAPAPTETAPPPPAPEKAKPEPGPSEPGEGERPKTWLPLLEPEAEKPAEPVPGKAAKETAGEAPAKPASRQPDAPQTPPSLKGEPPVEEASPSPPREEAGETPTEEREGQPAAKLKPEPAAPEAEPTPEPAPSAPPPAKVGETPAEPVVEERSKTRPLPRKLEAEKPAEPAPEKEPKETGPQPLPAESVGAEPAAAETADASDKAAPPPREIGDISAEPAKETPPQPPPAVEPPPTAPTPRSSPPAGRVTVSKTVEARVEQAPAAPEPEAKRSWFQRLRDGLSRSSRELGGNIAGVFTRRKLDEDALQDLEDVLIQADLGMETAIRITDTLASGRYGRDVSDDEVRTVMAGEIEKVLAPVALPLELDLSHKPHVILVVGVNGTGKTTTIGKLAAKLVGGGLDVMLAAGDTFRAAAIEQLKIWGERTGSPVVASKLGADAAGLAYDAFEKAKEAGSDVLIIDTAGRLQNKAELMAELEKIVRVLGKLDPEAPHTVLQTVDATTGQNALNQVEIFRNVAGVNGLVMTKLDGTARGGILVGIAARHKLPVYFIGVGEQVDDLEPFSAGEFARAIAGVA
ncbi:signal recognition particle-docking protein FtsY [Nitratireductor mangrovi]|uniref:Signal recognition particle receptor FtsY n=1 Tax=Nitratireductor mangrovi TaxID=2599600 RepID=A0A5B8L1H1_9HYPH|nr:signal recognition particle-docking protein FtsY [Nitratireductor mangrovi]QDZ01699.1 signal recognition particle-docking protein FtsY [Nitratireductor mangrovi]